MNFSAKLRFYFQTRKRFRGKVTEKVGKLRTLSRKDLRHLRIENRRPKGKPNLRDLFFVPQIWTASGTTNGDLICYPYVTFKAEEEQTFMMSAKDRYEISGLEYSVNNGTWKKVVTGEAVTFGGANGTLRLRGTNNLGGTSKQYTGYSQISFGNPTEYCYLNMFYGCEILSSVKMLAPSDQITRDWFTSWLSKAGTSAASRKLIVLDEAAYNALVDAGLPAKWKTGTEGATVEYAPKQ